jgi:hypothetical protein
LGRRLILPYTFLKLRQECCPQLPKSEVTFEAPTPEPSIAKKYTVTIPQWLAEKEGMV